MDPLYVAFGTLGGIAGWLIASRARPLPATAPNASNPGDIVMFGAVPIAPVQLPYPADVPLIPSADVLPNIARELNELHASLGASCRARSEDVASLDACLESLVHLLRASRGTAAPGETGRVPTRFRIPSGETLRGWLRADPGSMLVDLYLWRNYMATAQTAWLFYMRHIW